MDEDKVIVTTSRGVEVECLPIAEMFTAQEESLRASIEWPEKPVHVITDVAGSEIEQALTQEWVDSGQASDEETEAWEEYLTAQAIAQAEYDGKRDPALARLLAYRGIRLVDESLMDEWAEDHRWMGFDVPDDPRERLLHFLRTEILGNATTDMLEIMVGIYRASGADPDQLKEAETFFRSQMGRAAGDAAEGSEGDAEMAEPEAEDGLVDGALMGSNGNIDEVGEDT